MRFGSVCSGIEAASVASEPLGWEAAWFSEIEPFPCAVLKHHHPEVPNHGDMTLLPDRIRSGVVEAPDVLVGGTPCQAFSVAGHRKGLDDARGNLTLTFCGIADAIDERRMRNGDQPCIVFWENVPGVLSDKTNAFGCFLGELVGESDQLIPPGGKWANAGVVAGPQRTAAWIIKDAQYFGVAQRRRRVFVVASAREDFDPVSVLFEFDGLRRDSAPSRGEGKETSADVGAGVESAIYENHPHDSRVTGPYEFSRTLTSKMGTGGRNVPLVGPTTEGFRMVAFGEYADDDTASAMKARDYKDATDLVVGVDKASAQHFADVSPCLKTDLAHLMGPCVPTQLQVRRLTVTECERLMGFPDNYTQIPWRNKPADHCPDGPRYKALGNSWAVPCVRWIFERIDKEVKDVW